MCNSRGCNSAFQRDQGWKSYNKKYSDCLMDIIINSCIKIVAVTKNSKTELKSTKLLILTVFINIYDIFTETKYADRSTTNTGTFGLT